MKTFDDEWPGKGVDWMFGIFMKSAPAKGGKCGGYTFLDALVARGGSRVEAGMRRIETLESLVKS